MYRSIIGAAGALAALSSNPAIAADANADCHVAAYRLADGSTVDIAPEGSGALRWRMLDGRVGRLAPGSGGTWTSTRGWTKEVDGIIASFGDCAAGRISFAAIDGRAITFDVTETTFSSGGVTLMGRLVLPKGNARVPVMVLGHGSERHSALVNGFRQRLYPANGVGVFLFDKRGTGKSTGKYTQDFELLANDMVAAMQEARRLAGRRGSRFGFQGGSQAGWILPLAAAKTKADFVIVGYGIAASPLVEDRTETLDDLSAAGWGPDVLAKARQVTDATGAVIASRFTTGYEGLSAVVAKYRSEPWFKDLNGEFTGEIVKYPEAILRTEGPKRDEGTSWGFDAVGSLKRLKAPLLWIIAGADSEGPGEESRDNLLALKKSGKDITVALFPDTEHGIHEFRLSPAGSREETRYARGYFEMELEFARRGRLAGTYGKVQLLGSRR